MYSTNVSFRACSECVWFAAVNITRPRFSGSDEFGYTSFVAYSSIPSLSLFYEFKLKFTLADSSSAVKDNLMLFAGRKGQGEHNPDTWIAVYIIYELQWKNNLWELMRFSGINEFNTLLISKRLLFFTFKRSIPRLKSTREPSFLK